MFTTPFAFMAAPAGGGWTPADLPGIENWFKSDVGITLNGSTVSAWQDSLTSKSVIQATVANQPGFTSSNANFNGLPTVDFISTDTPTVINILENNTDFIYSGSFPLYCFIIARKNQSLGAAFFNFIGGGSDASVANRGAWSINIEDSSINGWTGSIGGLTNSISGTSLNATLLAGIGLTSTDIYTYFNSSSNAKSGSYLVNTNPKFFIGGYDSSNYAYNFAGSIAEVIITRGSVLSAGDLSDLWSYVQTKYAL
jgi:hypothetical protein